MMLIMMTVMVMISYRVQGSTDFNGVTLVCEDGWQIDAHNAILACSDDNNGDIDDSDEQVMVMNWWFHFRICQHVHGPSSVSSTSNRRGLRAHAARGRQHVSVRPRLRWGVPRLHQGHLQYTYNILCKNQIVVKNLRIVAQWWTSSEGHLLRLYFGVFQPSLV